MTPCTPVSGVCVSGVYVPGLFQGRSSGNAGYSGFCGISPHQRFFQKAGESAALIICRRAPIRARATLIDLADFDAPLFNADLDFLYGFPKSV